MEQKKVIFSRSVSLYFAVFTANISSFASGVAFAWPATIIPHLKSNDTLINPLPEPVTALEASWIVSSMFCGCLVGPFIGGTIMAKLGKKKAILLLCIPMSVGHVIIAFASRVWMFFVARFVMGLSLGCTYGLMASYVGDIAEDKNRGLLGSATTVLLSMGGLFVYTTGPFTSLKLFSFLNLLPGIVLITVFGLFVPETPYDLLQKNSIHKAERSLAFYRGKPLSEVDTEFKRLLGKIQDSKNSKDTTKATSIEQLKIIFKTRPLFKGIQTVGITILFHGLTGMAAVSANYQTIFDESGGSIESTYAVMIIGVITICAAVLTSQLVERLGRKLLLCLGFSFMSVALFSLGTYFLIKSDGYNINNISWLPLSSLMIFTLAYSIQGNVPFILMTDIFPSDILDIPSTLASFTAVLVAFIQTQVFAYLKETIGTYKTFYTFGSCMICAFVYTLFAIPETKGKSIEDVQKILSRK